MLQDTELCIRISGEFCFLLFAKPEQVCCYFAGIATFGRQRRGRKSFRKLSEWILFRTHTHTHTCMWRRVKRALFALVPVKCREKFSQRFALSSIGSLKARPGLSFSFSLSRNPMSRKNKLGEEKNALKRYFYSLRCFFLLIFPEPFI